MPTARTSVATAPGEVYLRTMLAMRLMRFLTLFALLVVPLGMMRGHAAMAMPVPAGPVGHQMGAMDSADLCAGMDQPSKDRPGSSIDCTIACSTIPSAESEIAAHPMATASIPPISLIDAVQGLHPESDPPPPRFA